ncbi:hypothetical protein WL76_17680 [Burkholderia ubonensis]|uniref:gp53-like domain-containing protein n=1 Tax=Burkholderia ubonensis TaxID=101571 RepID=UPI000756013B|nr:hypothetical protein [Burkholderia ubonensis]KWE51746.1 hypothetical protein WL76_17680 [Burkholderia ubonensis]
MTDLVESSTWTPGIRQFETSDPVEGGPDGIDNVPLRQLANRTRFLKDVQDAQAGGLEMKAPLASPAFTGSPQAPVPPQFDNTSKIATTAFVQRALGNYGSLNALSSATTLTAVNCGQTLDILGSSAFTVTLPAASACPSGSALTFICGSTYGSTLACQGSDKIYLPLGVASLALGYGDTLTVVSNGIGSWIAVSGTAQLSNAPEFASSLVTNGYQKLPSGLIIQWGYTSVPANSLLTVPLPIAFPNASFGVACAADDPAANGTQYRWTAGARTRWTINIVNNWPSGPISGSWITWGI